MNTTRKNPTVEDIKAKVYAEKAINDLFLDLIDYPDMTELELQICCTFKNDFRQECKEIEFEISSYITIAEKVLFLVEMFKSIKLIDAFMNCELYANYFKFYKDLSDDDYNQLAIKYIVINELI